MAKKMKRLTALALALVLCITQLAMPAAATETESPQPVVTIEAKPSSSETSKTESNFDPQTGITTTTTTTTTKTKDPATTTTNVKTEIDDPANSTNITQETERTEQKTSSGNTSTKEITETGEKTTTVGPVDNTNPEAPETDIKTTTVTNEQTQSQQTIETQKTPVDEGVRVGITDTGSSSSKTETTTTTTETTEKVKNGEEYTDPVTTVVVKPDGSEDPKAATPDKDLSQDENWDLGDIDAEWDNGTYQKGETVEEDPGVPVAQANVSLSDPLTCADSDDVVIEMTPGTTGSTQVEITTQNLRDGKFRNIYDPARQQSGDLVENRDSDGNLTGWTITNAATGEITTVTQKLDRSGNLTHWIISRTTEDPGARTLVTDPSNPDGVVITGEQLDTSSFTYVEISEMEQKLAEQKLADEKLAQQQGGDGQQAADGTETVRYEKIEKDDGTIGYRTINESITVKVSDPVHTDLAPELIEKHKSEQTEIKKWFNLPTNIPEPVTDRDNGDGTFTTIEVTPILDDAGSEFTTKGQVVGYTITTYTTGKNKKDYSREVQEIFGTAFRETVTTTFDPTTMETITTTTTAERTVNEIYKTQHTRTMDVDVKKTEVSDVTLLTETDTYQLLTTDTGDYFLYQGKMYLVTGGNTIQEKFDIASGSNVSMSGYGSSDDLRVNGQTGYDEHGNPRQITDHYTGQVRSNVNGSDWTHVGFGLYSHFTAKDSNGGAHGMKQFMLKKGNEIRYVYCVELNTGTAEGSYYDQVKYDAKKNQNIAPWYNADGTIRQIHSVAQNGFWGTADGLGSLQAVKDLMTRNGLVEEAKKLTEGMAVAATQLALWEYGADGVSFNESGHTGSYLTFDDMAGSAPSAEDKNVIGSLRNLLIRLADAGGTVGHAQVITKESITGGSIKVKEEVAPADSSGNKTYNTDISFTLAVSTSSINGDLVLEIKDADNKTIGKYRLAGNDKKDLTDLIATRIHPNADGTYTLKDVELVENQPVTLHLTGTQHLEDGVYLYQNPSKQDFVGLSTLTNEVDLSVKMEFSVEEPEFTHQMGKSSASRTDSYTYKGKGKRTDTATVVLKADWQETGTTVSLQQNVLSTKTVVTELYQITGERASWEKYYEDLWENRKGGDGDDPILADVPRTDDHTLLWAVISLLCLAGFSLLSVQPKKKMW